MEKHITYSLNKYNNRFNSMCTDNEIKLYIYNRIIYYLKYLSIVNKKITL